jgi:predicted permease
LLSESVLLGLVGGVLGLLLARAGLALLAQLAPATLPRLEEIGINPVVIAFTAIISVGTGLLFGLLPVHRLRHTSVTGLKEGSRSVSEGPERHRVKNVLVITEIALALTLLIVSGLMIRTFIALRLVEPGFTRPEEVETFRVSVPDAIVADADQAVRVHEQIADRLRHVPGVLGVGVSSSVTMDGSTSNDPIFFEDFPEPSGRIPQLRRYKYAGPGYVQTMGNHLVAGRTLTWEDAHQRRRVVMISENMARKYWHVPAAALGRRIRNTPANPWREIVGVVGDERDNGLNEAAPEMVYWPVIMDHFWTNDTFARRTLAYVVRSPRTGMQGFVRELQGAVWSVNSNLPLANIRTLDAIRANSMAQTSFALYMLAIAASVALLLGVVGIYGIVAYIVAQRTREIGIRIALGAQMADVSRLFLRHGFMLTITGLAIGVGVSLGITRVLATLLYGVTPSDPLTYGVVCAVLGGVAIAATYLPARRASRVDPVVALRADG